MRGIGTAPNLERLTTLYLVFHILGGQIGLPIIVLTFLFSKNVSRHPTLINFCITWILYSVSHCILIYGGQTREPNPPGRLCRAQAAMINGTTTMAAVTGLAVVIQIWTTFRDPQQSCAGKKWPHSTRLTLTLLLPYVVFSATTLTSAILGNKYSKYVNASNGLYCTFNKDPYRRFGVPLFCTTVLVLIVGFETAIAIRYYRICAHISRAFPLADRKTSLSIVFRVGIFNLYSVVTLSVGIFLLSDTVRPWLYMVQAPVPLTAALVFGTQKDLLLAWCFWKRKRKPTYNTSDEAIPSAHEFRNPVPHCDSISPSSTSQETNLA